MVRTCIKEKVNRESNYKLWTKIKKYTPPSGWQDGRRNLRFSVASIITIITFMIMPMVPRLAGMRETPLNSLWRICAPCEMKVLLLLIGVWYWAAFEQLLQSLLAPCPSGMFGSAATPHHACMGFPHGQSWEECPHVILQPPHLVVTLIVSTSKMRNEMTAGCELRMESNILFLL